MEHVLAKQMSCLRPPFHFADRIICLNFSFEVFAKGLTYLGLNLVQHVWCVSDDLLGAKEKNKKMEEEMEAAFQDIQNM